MAINPMPAGRNLIVCCDGTSNEINANLTNVLKLYRILVKDDQQRVFYDPGVGTSPRPRVSTPKSRRDPGVVTVSSASSGTSVSRWVQKWGGLALGVGLWRNVQELYEVLVDHYAEIDAHLQLRGHKMGKNDLWIAATTVSLGATLLTTDRDFDELDPLFLKRDWVSPVVG